MSNVSTARARSAQAAGAAAGRFRLVMASLALLLAVTAVASLCLGRYSLTGTEVMAVLLPDGWLSVETNRMMENIVLNVRLPRVLLAIIAGAGLAMSGAAFQALFANPLAAPDTLGVATGASFGAVLGILWGWNGMGIQLMSLATGLSAVFFVIVISRVRNTSSILMIILSGMVVGALFSALVSLVKYAAGRAAVHHLLDDGGAHGRDQVKRARGHAHGAPRHARSLAPALAPQRDDPSD